MGSSAATAKQEGRVSLSLSSSLSGQQLSIRSISRTNIPMAWQQLQDAKNKFTPPENLGNTVDVAEVKRFMVSVMMAGGVAESQSSQLADVLVAGDHRGHFSHGMNRLEMYLNDCQTGICDGNAQPTIEKESVSTALVDGKNGLGPVVGNFCMDLAIKKAKETGIGWVCARGSNHYGIAGWYALRASDKGLIGMSFTNTSPLVAPTRAKTAALGTNPIAVSAPSSDPQDPFVLDMATCTVAVGKIELQKRKQEPMPEGWAINKEGRVTQDPAEALAGGALMPLGGQEINSGYKGFGLAMMVEVFCGLLSGGQYGPNVRRWMDTTRQADLGQCFVAIDPSFFAPGFGDRMGDLMNTCRSMDPVEKEAPVLVAGDPERRSIEKVKKEKGITYHNNQIKDCWKLAQHLKIPVMKSF